MTSQNNQHEINKRGIAKCLSVLGKDRDLARSAFMRLTTNQKQFLLMASGLPTEIKDWAKLTNDEVKKIQYGVRRLKLIINEFNAVTDNDYQKSIEFKNIKGLNNETKHERVA